jgi:hypothetical protein
MIFSPDTTFSFREREEKIGWMSECMYKHGVRKLKSFELNTFIWFLSSYGIVINANCHSISSSSLHGDLFQRESDLSVRQLPNQ